jgi:hypothetical protein
VFIGVHLRLKILKSSVLGGTVTVTGKRKSPGRLERDRVM